ncbi:MAG: TM2 domain-containing protein [Tenuifilaceae bacterium]|nr:TM2 domain-containing protein [Tenuifilaceae bacterium]
MKKVLFVSVLVFCAVFSSYSSNYKVSDVAVDNLFANATEVSVVDMTGSFAMGSSATATFVEKDPVVATIICFFVGGFGVHRHYLGTKGGMWAIYTFTCGGIFGVVPLVDFFVLIIDGIAKEGIGKYVDNEKFFMWN